MEIPFQQSYISNTLQETIDSITINKEWFWRWLFVLATFLTVFYAGIFVLISMMDFSDEQQFDRRRKYEMEQKEILEKKARGETDSEKVDDQDDLSEDDGEALDQEEEDDYDEHSNDSFKEPQFGGIAVRRKNS